MTEFTRGHQSNFGPMSLGWVAALMLAAGACSRAPLAAKRDGGGASDASRDAAGADRLESPDEAAFPSDWPNDGLVVERNADQHDGDIGAAERDTSQATDSISAFDRPPLADGPMPDGAADGGVDRSADTATDSASAPGDGGARDVQGDVRNQCVPVFFPDLCDGVCTDVRTDIHNCGSCGQACPKRPNADTVCSAGACVDTCRANWFDCSKDDPADGCETRIDTPDNCGTCGRAACPGSRFIGTCVNGTPVCGSPICQAGYGTCDPASSGCQTPWTSAASAGACFPTFDGVGAVVGEVVDGLLPLFVAVASDGVTYVAGLGEGAVDLDPTSGVDARTLAFRSVVLVRLRADGSYDWGRVISPKDARSSLTLAALAIGTDGAPAVTGSFSGTVDMDPGSTEDSRASTGGDLFVTKVSAAGALVWSKVFPVPTNGATSTSIVAGADGGFVLLGHFTGPIDLDPGSASDLHSSPTLDMPFLVGLGGDGARRWASTFDQTGDTCGGLSLSRLAVAPSGALVLIGNFYGDCDFAPGSPVARRPVGVLSGAVIIKVDASGGYVGSRVLNGGVLSDLVAAADGTLFAGGIFSGTVDFGAGSAPLTRTADIRQSGFLMKMSSDLGVSWVSDGLAALWVLRIGATPDKGILAVLQQEDGSVAISKLDDHQQASWTMPLGGSGTQTQISDLAIGGGMLVVVGTDTGNDLDPGPGVSRVPGGAGFLARLRL